MSINLLPAEIVEIILDNLSLRDWYFARLSSKLFLVGSLDNINHKYYLISKFRTYLQNNQNTNSNRIIESCYKYQVKNNRTNYDKGLLLAAKIGDLDMFRIFLVKPIIDLYHAVKRSIKYGQYHIMNQILDFIKHQDNEMALQTRRSAFLAACRYGNKKLILTLMCEDNGSYWLDGLLSLLLRGDHEYLDLIESFNNKRWQYVINDKYGEIKNKIYQCIGQGGNINILNAFLNMSSDMIQDSHIQMSLMEGAIKARRYEMIQYLIEGECDDWNYYLSLAIGVGDKYLVKKFMAKGGYYKDSLFLAAYDGHYNLVKFFYKRQTTSPEEILKILEYIILLDHDKIVTYLLGKIIKDSHCLKCHFEQIVDNILVKGSIYCRICDVNYI